MTAVSSGCCFLLRDDEYRIMAPKCCLCNGSGKCVGCLCKKGRRLCRNCAPGVHGRCLNRTAASIAASADGCRSQVRQTPLVTSLAQRRTSSGLSTYSSSPSSLSSLSSSSMSLQNDNSKTPAAAAGSSAVAAVATRLTSQKQPSLDSVDAGAGEADALSQRGSDDTHSCSEGVVRRSCPTSFSAHLPQARDHDTAIADTHGSLPEVGSLSEADAVCQSSSQPVTFLQPSFLPNCLPSCCPPLPASLPLDDSGGRKDKAIVFNPKPKQRS